MLSLYIAISHLPFLRQSKGILEKSGEKQRLKDQGRESDDDKDADKGPALLSVDQSAITGESLAVEKYIGEIAYYTCIVKRGKVIDPYLCSQGMPIPIYLSK
jgi:hypothetical protein